MLVSAPAGFGKSTLLAEWLAGRTRTAWFSIDVGDNDPAVFWAYVIAALESVEPGVGDTARSVLGSSPGSLEPALAALVNDLDALDDDVVLVLDDYHLIDSTHVHEQVTFLLEHLPRRVQLVIGSRADPPLPLPRLRARGELIEMRAADLRFTTDEAASYLNDAMGLTLAAHDVAALEARTEGWIAALQLAALSLHGRDDTAAFIENFAGDDRFVVDYLAEEVLERQPQPIRDFLLRTSILSRLTGSLCDAVTGGNDGKATLEALDRANLFLVALDDRRAWYRYHHLFAEVLRARLADEGPDRIAGLHRRAGDWFDAEGDRAEAVRHALAAGDFPRAAELVELAIPSLRQTRQEATQRAWLDALPPDVFANRPVLSLALVGARMVTGDTAGVENLLEGIERWTDPDAPAADMVVHDATEFGRLPAQAAMYRAALSLLGGDLAGTVSHAERAAALSAADDHFGRGAAAALIGLAQWADGHLEAAERQYSAAIASFERAGHLPDVLACSLGLADIQFAQGRLGAAQRTLAAGLDLGTANGPLRGTADMRIGLGELHFERNELDVAAEQLRAGVKLGDRLAFRQHASRWRVLDARLRAAGGEHAAALALLSDAERLYDTDYSPKARPVAATTARIRLAGGDVIGAERWAAEAGLTVDDDPSYLREYEQLTFARVLLAGGRPTDASGLLLRIVAGAGAGRREGNAIEALALLALAHDATGDAPQALATLEEALTRASVEGFVRVFIDAGPPMNTLLKAALRRGGRGAEHAAAVLAVGGSRPSGAQPVLVDDLSRRERDVLRLLRTDLSGPEIAAELVVSLNTVRTHTRNVFMKLGVNSRRAAVRRADELGL